MSRRPARIVAAGLATVLLVPALAACGSSSKDSSGSSSSLKDAVTITGDVGTKIDAKWHSKLAKPSKVTVTTLVEGTGGTIATGDNVNTYLWIGNGSKKKVAYSDYTNGQPEVIPNDSARLGPVLSKLFAGATYGSRVAAVATGKDLFGSDAGNAQLGISGKENLVIIADLVKKAPTAPTPSDDKAHDVPASKMPKIVLKKGKPAGLDFAGIKKPSLKTPVQRVVLKKGTGKAVKATDTVTVNYLGATYDAKAPFDESFSKQPMTQSLGGLIQGWKIGLTGVKVGSRVLIQIPPAYGYGAQGSGSTIPGNATLWFVVDVLKTKGA